MGQQIKLPSNRLSEHATSIARHAADLKVKTPPYLGYSTGSAQSLQYGLSEIAEGLNGFDSAVRKESENLRNIEKAMVEEEKKLAHFIAQAIKG